MPKPCVLLDNAVMIYRLACRERRYIDGTPMPISTSDISKVVAVRESLLPRPLLDDVVFIFDGRKP